MKYQVGDRVKIKSFDWFRNGACIGFSTLMSKYCGEVLTIQSKNNTNTYCMKEDGGQFYWSDDMIEGAMNISKLGTAANPVEPKSNANCLTRERVDELAIKIDKELPSGNPNVWELPDGYQFVDENGNVINATKIALEKKKPEYPKTYDECCKVLSLGEDGRLYTNGYKASLIQDFQKLLICRDAYWKIAGEENKGNIDYVICNVGGKIINTNIPNSAYNHILTFPTEEMRDAFYKNFKKEIEICKEFL
jgi:hypothetical protein